MEIPSKLGTPVQNIYRAIFPQYVYGVVHIRYLD